MENTQTPQIKDLRQSENWSKYLEWVGWKSFRTSRDINIEIMATPMGGFVKVQRPPVLTKEDLTEIEEIARVNKALFVKIEPSYPQDVTLFEQADYAKSYSPLCAPSTMLIDLSLSEEQLLSKVSKRKRYSIRKSNVRTEFIKRPSPEMIKKFYEIASASAQKHKFTLQGFNHIAKQAEVFGENCLLAIGYDDQNREMGAKVILTYGDIAWYVHAGTTELGRVSDSGSKMMWDLFLYLKTNGYKYLDLDGIDDPRFPLFTQHWGGFSFFKEQFGGEVVRFPYSYVKYFSRWLRFMARYGKMPF